MNKVLLPSLAFVCSLFFNSLFAQVPQGFSYQAVACDANGSELVNQAIRVRASILKDGLNGTAQWIEIHAFDPVTSTALKTDQFGLFTLVIGQGQAQAGGTVNAFSSVDWAYGNLWLKIELDPAGGSNFATIGAQRIFSVPYAIYAEKAKAADAATTATTATSAGTALDDQDRDDKNEIQSLAYDPANNTITISNPSGGSGSGTPIAIMDGDRDATNELQNLAWDPATNMLSIVKTGGSASIPLPGAAQQNLTYDATGNVLTLSGTTPVTLSDGDRDATNELQNLSYDPATGNISIVKTGGSATVNIPGTVAGSDLQKINYDAATNSLSLSPALPGATPVTLSDGDRDAQNELQKLSYDPATNSFTMSPAQPGATPVAISDGDRDATNELQTLAWDPATNTLSITHPNGNNPGTSINIPGGQLQGLAYDPATNTISINPAPANGVGSVAITDGDRDATNELRQLSWNAQTKTLSLVPTGQGGTNNLNLPVDLSETNELQTIGYNAASNTLTISPAAGGGATQTVNLTDGDRDATNELQSLNFNPATGTLTISPAPAGQAASVQISDNDANPTNELQQLTYDTLTNELKLGPAPAGSGGTSIVKLNSISFGDPGADVVYPNGLKGDYKVVAENFIVPVGRTFYVTAGGSTVRFKHPTYTGGNEVTGYTAPSQPIFPSGTTITSCYCTGFLTDEDPFLNTQIIDLNSGVFTVPLDKVLYIKSGLPIDKSYLNISTDGGSSYVPYELGLSPNQAATRIITIPGGTKIGKLPLYAGTAFWLTGYLLRL